MNLNRRVLLSGGTSMAMLGSFGPAFAASKKTESVGEFRWKRFGVDKFAATDEEAFQKLPTALKALGVPERLHAGFVDLVRQFPKGQRTGQLHNGDRLNAMMSGKRGAHRNVLVAFEDVVHGKMGPPPAYTREWELEGITLILPGICHNWSWRGAVEECHFLTFATYPGVEILVGLVGPTEIPLPNHCLNHKQGSGPWLGWSGACPVDCDMSAVVNFASTFLPNAAADFHNILTYAAATKERQTLRLPLEVVQGYVVVICLEYKGHKRTVYMPPKDWHERRTVDIQPEDWSKWT